MSATRELTRALSAKASPEPTQETRAAVVLECVQATGLDKTR